MCSKLKFKHKYLSVLTSFKHDTKYFIPARERELLLLNQILKSCHTFAKSIAFFRSDFTRVNCRKLGEV